MSIKLPSLKDLVSGFGMLTSLNENFRQIGEALDKVLWRDGTAPNAMQSPLDMGGYPLLNLPKPSNPTAPIRAVDLTEGTLELDLSSTIPDGSIQEQQLSTEVQSKLDDSATALAAAQEAEADVQAHAEALDPHPQYMTSEEVKAQGDAAYDVKGAASQAEAGANAYTDSVIPEFASVAVSGSYDDLQNIPTDFTPPTASATRLGGIKLGDNITVDANGVAHAEVPTKLNDFADVEITSPALGQTLKWNGVGWVNADAPSGGSISDDEFLLKLVSALSAGTGISISVVNGRVVITNTGASGDTTEPPAETYHFSLEDGSGDLLMEDGTSYLLLEEAA